MQDITISITNGVAAIIADLYRQRYGIEDMPDDAAVISKVMAFEVQELAKQSKRETAVAVVNQQIKASQDFVKTDFELDMEAKALAQSTALQEQVDQPGAKK